MGALSTLSDVLLAAFGLAALLASIQLVAIAPLSVAYGSWKRRTLKRLSQSPFRGRVSVVVPAYNEEKTLRACVESILASDYPDMELIVVDDGSADRTAETVRDLQEQGRIVLVLRPNGGKARALNQGAALATGEVLLFTDADSLFAPETVGQMARWFADLSVDAVCGNDKPLTTRTPLQKVLAVTTHIGTGFVRRALSLAGVLPIITGNLGAFRAATFRDIGGFRPIWGEDFDLTLRLQKARRRIVFDPEAIVRADCPATLRALWQQRLRWLRSYIKIVGIHRELLWPPRVFPFSLYLPFNGFLQIVVPLLQILSVPVFLQLALAGNDALAWSMNLVFYLGLLTFVGVAVGSVALDRDWAALRHMPLATLLIVPLSYFYNLIVVTSLWKEIAGESERWHKAERTPSGRRARWGGAGLAFATFALIAIAAATRYPSRDASSATTSEPQPEPYAHMGDAAIATHFDGWEEWRRATTSILENPDARSIRIVGLGVGRPEWTFFRWEGHRSNWSSTQRGESVDLFGTSTEALRQRGFRVVGIVDLYAPRLIEKEPSRAAVSFDGERSVSQVEFMDLVDGAYGREVVDMLAYAARHYAVEGLALTELAYKHYCYDDACLRSYRAATGRAAWPLTTAGSINHEDPSIWDWRSAQMEAFVARAAQAVHAAGKELFVDVPVSWDDLPRNGRDAGLDYERVLKHADRIVVWNYFAVENRKPEVSLAVARHLRRHFPEDRVFVSLGLWGATGTVSPERFREALAYTLQGGIRNVWITPNHMLTPRHWEAMRSALNTAFIAPAGRSPLPSSKARR